MMKEYNLYPFDNIEDPKERAGMIMDYESTRSARALEAERRGFLTAKQFMLKYRKFFKGLHKKDVEMVMSDRGWHHTGHNPKSFAEVKYYNPLHLRQLKNREALRQAIFEREYLAQQKWLIENGG